LRRQRDGDALPVVNSKRKGFFKGKKSDYFPEKEKTRLRGGKRNGLNPKGKKKKTCPTCGGQETGDVHLGYLRTDPGTKPASNTRPLAQFRREELAKGYLRKLGQGGKQERRGWRKKGDWK